MFVRERTILYWCVSEYVLLAAVPANRPTERWCMCACCAYSFLFCISSSCSLHVQRNTFTTPSTTWMSALPLTHSFRFVCARLLDHTQRVVCVRASIVLNGRILFVGIRFGRLDEFKIFIASQDLALHVPYLRDQFDQIRAQVRERQTFGRKPFTKLNEFRDENGFKFAAIIG